MLLRVYPNFIAFLIVLCLAPLLPAVVQTSTAVNVVPIVTAPVVNVAPARQANKKEVGLYFAKLKDVFAGFSTEEMWRRFLISLLQYEISDS